MSFNTGKPQDQLEVGVEMTNMKSIIVAFEEIGWLLVILLICAATVAASSILSRPRFRHFRQIAATIFYE